jgi:hypothetical protein
MRNPSCVNRRRGPAAVAIVSIALKVNKLPSSRGHDRRRLGPHHEANSVIGNKELLKMFQGASFGADLHLEGIHQFMLDAEVVDGPPELREIVAELWPELLHKVKPPRSEMH